eukprot:TRINITY_DN6773_c0_g3_i1.p1 TRINITY_DN6773_c0_g3~~TRINITY_DN6773_c0_g3_i1.p1  ORF type:complete len:210 (-),score=25.97 TRINITY_DN6773_c0_g3_i1:199-828(-)
MQYCEGLQGHAQMRMARGSLRLSSVLVVVCHERCYKADFEEKTRWLYKKSKRRECRTLRFKNVTGFEEWVSGHGDQPYVLIVGWREAKPCSEVFQRCPPTTLLLLADTSKASLPRAQDWAIQHGATILPSLNDITEEVVLDRKPLPLPTMPAVVPSFGAFTDAGDDLMRGYHRDDRDTKFHDDVTRLRLQMHEFEEQTSEMFGWVTLHL